MRIGFGKAEVYGERETKEGFGRTEAYGKTKKRPKYLR
jgi:hypothetical protein